ncbi:MAG: hypothetical protein JSU63_03575, partial [Phycisphaerales bacterium]
MPLARHESGVWRANLSDSELDRISSLLAEAMPRYLTIVDEIFAVAKRTNELEFLFSLFRVRGAQNPGWDPYQTTLESIPALVDCANTTQNDTVARHLQLWIYGHILEASEPYELLANLLEVAGGRHYAWNTNFPPKKSGVPNGTAVANLCSVKHLRFSQRFAQLVARVVHEWIVLSASLQ